MKPTWTYKEDLPDQPNDRLPVEEMQEEYLIERIGNVMYAALQEAERERANRIKVEG